MMAGEKGLIILLPFYDSHLTICWRGLGSTYLLEDSLDIKKRDQTAPW